MEKWKQIFNKLLFPGTAVIILGVPAAAALLYYTFAYAHENDPIAYAAYFFSAYITVIACAAVPPLAKDVSALVHRNRYLHRYLTDIPFRTHISLYLSLGINASYAVLKLLLGMYYHSVWFGTFGVYYSLLAIMRFLLLRHARQHALGKDMVAELKKYRLCGMIFIPMNIAMSGAVVLILKYNKGFEYTGYLIYVVAMYAFYAMSAAIVNLIKYRKYRSPVMSASKMIRLASALVSILSLETAMLSQFGDSNNLFFQQVMTASTGAGICIIMLGIAVYMMTHATKQLKRLQANSIHF